MGIGEYYVGVQAARSAELIRWETARPTDTEVMVNMRSGSLVRKGDKTALQRRRWGGGTIYAGGAPIAAGGGSRDSRTTTSVHPGGVPI